ncbi:MAG: hypothetical protein ACPG5R_04700 [Cognaticolwellia aestuarii]
MKVLKKSMASMVMLTSLAVNAGVEDFGLVNPCEEKLLGIFELSNTTRINSVESIVQEQLAEIKEGQRFVNYDVKEIADEIQAEFITESGLLSAKLSALRSEYISTNLITLDNGKQLDGFAASEYLKIMMSRYIAQISGAEYLQGIYDDLEVVRKDFGKAIGRLTVIESLIDSSSSDDVLSSACIALKEVEKLGIDLPFRDATSLKNYALKQSKPVTDSELQTYLDTGKLNSMSLAATNGLDSFMNWAKSLVK